ncbi:unnamed protein product, partial [Rotaria magnacalcarata]
MTTSLRSETTIDLIISNEHQYSVQSQPLAHNGSDHFPILTEFTDITTTEQINTIPKVNWESIQRFLPSLVQKYTMTLNPELHIHLTALSDDKYTLNDPVQILSHLIDHFTSRFTPPVTDMNVQTDKEAQELWNVLSKADHVDIQQACQNSDLKFS